MAGVSFQNREWLEDEVPEGLERLFEKTSAAEEVKEEELETGSVYVLRTEHGNASHLDIGEVVEEEEGRVFDVRNVIAYEERFGRYSAPYGPVVSGLSYSIGDIFENPGQTAGSENYKFVDMPYE